jgi:serine/threonine protein phosphatase PrpC
VYGFGDHVLEESERVEAAGGWIVDGRVCNILAVSRAFGDPEFKVIADAGQQLTTTSFVQLTCTGSCYRLGCGRSAKHTGLESVLLQSVLPASTGGQDSAGRSSAAASFRNIIFVCCNIFDSVLTWTLCWPGLCAGSDCVQGEGLQLLLNEGGEKGSWPKSFAATHKFKSDPVIPLPDVTMVDFEREVDEFLVVATDGLWDCMPPNEAIRFAR